MSRGRILIFLSIFVLVNNSSCAIHSLYETGKNLWKLYLIMDNIRLDTFHNLDSLFMIENGKKTEIRNLTDEIHEQINEIAESMNFAAIRRSFKLLPSFIILYSAMDRIDILTKNIDEHYNEFHQYMTEENYHSDDSLRHFMEKLLSIEGDMDVIRKLVVDEGEFSLNHANLVSAIMRYANMLKTEICGGPQTISRILFQLFKTVIIVEIKSHIMLAFANMYRYIGDAEGWKQLNYFAKTHFEEHFATYVNLFGSRMRESDAIYLRACDPDGGSWTQDTSFYELDGTFGTTIFRYHWSMCKFNSCNDVWFKKSTICQANYYDARSSCSHSVSQCAYLNSMEACVLKSGPHKFQYVNSKELGSLGRDTTCPTDNGYFIRDGLAWNYTYRTCACNCNENYNKISLVMIESNVEMNKVITGFRFFRKNRILFIQPREGKLGNDGRINRYSERWIPVPNNLYESQIRTINKYNANFFFGDSQLPTGQLLTGVKFNQITMGKITGFAIEIFGIRFDYKSGRLETVPQFRKSKEALSSYLGKPLEFEAVSSIRTNLTHILSLEDKKYVSLKRSTLRDDFGQSTLPLFDAVPVRSHPSSPLGGIGIFHKVVNGYAGFISLRVYGISYNEYFQEFEYQHIKYGKVSFNDSWYSSFEVE